MDTNRAQISFGKYYGEWITRVPYSYLIWGITNKCMGEVVFPDGRVAAFYEVAKAEIARRGEKIVDIDISRHAINRASLRLNSLWQRDHRPDEGLHSWLERWSEYALSKIKDSLSEFIENPVCCEKENQYMFKINNKEVIFVLDTSGAIPVLKTVMRKGDR